MISYGFGYALAPIIIAAGAIFLMLISFISKIDTKNYSLIAVLFLFLAIVVQFSLFGNIEVGYLFPDIFGQMFIIDQFSLLFDILFLSGAMFTLLINSHYFKTRDYYNGEFFSLLLLSVFGMIVLAHAHELITAFIALEIASIAVYILVGYNRTNIKSSEAMLKYIVLGALTAGFFIFGVALIYGAVGSTYFGDIYKFLMASDDTNLLVAVGLLFMLVMMLFKIGVVPFHSWVIDVYHGAPFPVTMFMAATFKIAIFALLLRLFLVDFSPMYHIFSTVLYVTAFLTLIGGSLLTIAQSNLKRMLAGSSIVHGGYLLIALYSISVGAEFASSAIVFYLIAYFISGVGAFGILSYIASDSQKRLTFEDFKGFAHERPYMAAMMSIFVLSLAGFPSTIGFLGKLYIFISAIEAGQLLLAGFAIFVAFVSTYYYFKLIALMYFYPSKSETKQKKSFPITISSICIALLALMTIWGGIGTELVSFLPGADSLIQIAHEAISKLKI